MSKEPAAAVAIVRARRPKESILLIRRSERKEDPWSGHWSFPGGRRDPEDPDLLQTALRELEEECGIRLDREQRQAALLPVLARRKDGPFVLVAPFVFDVDCELPTAVDPREAVEAVWVARNWLCNPAHHYLRAVPSHPDVMLYPSVDLKGRPLWGFTYRLITDWLGLVPKPFCSEHAAFQAACRVLDFLLSRGLVLKRGWKECPAKPETADEHSTVKVAQIEGPIPVGQVLDRFTAPLGHVPCLNLLEVRPDHIRMAGLGFEEYWIETAGYFAAPAFTSD